MNGLKNGALRSLIGLALAAVLTTGGLATAAPSKTKASAAVDLTGTGWFRVDASDDGSHKVMYFGPGGVLVVANANAQGEVLNKTLGRYTQVGDTVILADSTGIPLVYWTMVRDGKGWIHMTRSDGVVTDFLPLCN